MSGPTRPQRIPLDVVVTSTGERTPGVLVAVMAADLDALEARVDALEEALTAALEELYGEHYQSSPDHVGCIICWPEDSRWPCTARMVADDLRAVLTDRGAET